MTAACGGGTSGPTFGAAAVVQYSSARIAELLFESGEPWLEPFIPLLALAPLVLNTFCASDPPPAPTFTQAEVDAVLQLTLGPDFTSALAKAKDWILNLIWNDTCECTSGAFVPPVAPTQPNGSITIINPLGQQNAPCANSPQFVTQVFAGNDPCTPATHVN